MSAFFHKKLHHPLHPQIDLHRAIFQAAVYIIWMVLFLSLVEILRRITSGF